MLLNKRLENIDISLKVDSKCSIPTNIPIQSLWFDYKENLWVKCKRPNP